MKSTKKCCVIHEQKRRRVLAVCGCLRQKMSCDIVWQLFRGSIGTENQWVWNYLEMIVRHMRHRMQSTFLWFVLDQFVWCALFWSLLFVLISLIGDVSSFFSAICSKMFKAFDVVSLTFTIRIAHCKPVNFCMCAAKTTHSFLAWCDFTSRVRRFRSSGCL